MSRENPVEQRAESDIPRWNSPIGKWVYGGAAAVAILVILSVAAGYAIGKSG